MKQQEITTLKLIKSLERDPEQTQRDLAGELNISLGLVNAFIKRLVKKGHFKVKTIPKNRIRYILTPAGMYEKTRLTYQYLSYSLEFYKETRHKIRTIYDRLSDQGKERVFLIGTSELTEIALITLQESTLQLAGIIDDKKAGASFLGVVISSFQAFNQARPGDIAMITNPELEDSLYRTIVEYMSRDSIITLND